jgi:hypothetical protein
MVYFLRCHYTIFLAEFGVLLAKHLGGGLGLAEKCEGGKTNRASTSVPLQLPICWTGLRYIFAFGGWKQRSTTQKKDEMVKVHTWNQIGHSEHIKLLSGFIIRLNVVCGQSVEVSGNALGDTYPGCQVKKCYMALGYFGTCGCQKELSQNYRKPEHHAFKRAIRSAVEWLPRLCREWFKWRFPLSRPLLPFSKKFCRQ